MKVPMPDELDEKQMKGLNEFLKETFLLTDEENAALENVSPMTYEMFKHLVAKLWNIGCENSYCRLLLQYPEFTEREVAEIEAELKSGIDEFIEPTDEETQESWKRLCNRIRGRYGENAI